MLITYSIGRQCKYPDTNLVNVFSVQLQILLAVLLKNNIQVVVKSNKTLRVKVPLIMQTFCIYDHTLKLSV